MLGIFKKKKNITIKIESNLSNQKLENIERKMIQIHSEFEKITEIQKKYKSILEKYFCITEELWTKNTYKLVNSQESVFNKYADRYIELCNMYLQILPEYIEYDIEIGKVHNEKRIFKRTPQDIVNMIRLLEKQEKYNEIINVCKYLLSLGITEDGTKKGIKGRIEKAISKFNKEFNTNYDYQSKNNLIINLDNGEIME